jgi:hypothetical protein
LVSTREKKWWLYLLYLSSALAFLTKGLIGGLFPFAILVIWQISSGQWKRTFDLISPIGIAIFLAITTPWFILVQRVHPDFLRFFFIQEHFLRYTTTMHGRDNTIFLYLPVILLGILPWAAFIGKAALEMYKGKLVSSPLQGNKFLWTWIIFIFVFYSLSHSKLIPYFIPLSVLIGNKLRNYDALTINPGKPSRSFLFHIPILLQSLLLIALFLLPLFLHDGSKLGGDLSIVFPREQAWLFILPIVSQLLLSFLPEMVKSRYQHGWFVTIYILSGLFLLSIAPSASAFLTPYKSAYPASQAIKRVLPAGTELYQYKIILYGISTYNELRTPLVGDFGELSYGMKFLPKEERDHYFLTEEQFKARCDQNGTIYCLTEYKNHFNELTKMFPHHEVLWSNGAYYLVKLMCQTHNP